VSLDDLVRQHGGLDKEAQPTAFAHGSVSISYGLMTLLIVEQGTTIQSQRALIRELFSDSMQLSAMRGKAVRDQNAADVQKHVPKQARPSQTQANTAQAGSVQTPSSQAQDLAPSSQAAAPQRAQSHAAKTHKPRMQMPSRPARIGGRTAGASDDLRRRILQQFVP